MNRSPYAPSALRWLSSKPPATARSTITEAMPHTMPRAMGYRRRRSRRMLASASVSGWMMDATRGCLRRSGDQDLLALLQSAGDLHLAAVGDPGLDLFAAGPPGDRVVDHGVAGVPLGDQRALGEEEDLLLLLEHDLGVGG